VAKVAGPGCWPVAIDALYRQQHHRNYCASGAYHPSQPIKSKWFSTSCAQQQFQAQPSAAANRDVLDQHKSGLAVLAAGCTVALYSQA